MVMDAVYDAFWTWSSLTPVIPFKSWRKLVPCLEDLHGCPNEGMIKSRVLDMMCAVKSFQNLERGNI